MGVANRLADLAEDGDETRVGSRQWRVGIFVGRPPTLFSRLLLFEQFGQSFALDQLFLLAQTFFDEATSPISSQSLHNVREVPRGKASIAHHLPSGPIDSKSATSALSGEAKTNLRLKKGQRVRFQVSGNWSAAHNKNGIDLLTLAIGESGKNAFWVIGGSPEFSHDVDKSGWLFLGITDPFVRDNSGEVEVVVTVFSGAN